MKNITKSGLFNIYWNFHLQKLKNFQIQKQKTYIFSSPELKAQGELLWSLTVCRRRRRRPYVRPSVHNL